MQLGYSVTSFHGADLTPREAADRVVDRAAVAGEAGYDYVEAGDHHAVAGGQYLQNVPTAGRLAGVVDHVGAMFLLPLYDPVLVAEQAGTLAALAEEFQFWVAVGGGQGQFDAFGIPLAERAARFEESLELIRRLWSEESVTFDGEFYQVEDVSVNPKADPRVCIGGGADPAVQRAGRLGDAWVAGPAESREDLAEKIALFDEAGGGRVVVRRDALVLDDRERAMDLAEATLEAGYRGWPTDADWVLSGNADDVAAELERLAELGVDEVAVRPMTNEQAKATLRQVAKARRRL